MRLRLADDNDIAGIPITESAFRLELYRNAHVALPCAAENPRAAGKFRPLYRKLRHGANRTPGEKGSKQQGYRSEWLHEA